MRFDCYNFADICAAADVYRGSTKPEPFIFVIHTPGQETYRFLVNLYGIVREQCNRKGDPINHDA